MKMFIGLIALVIATPVVAQKNTIADIPHGQASDHSQHTSKHDCSACCETMKCMAGEMAGTERTANRTAVESGQSRDVQQGHAN